jgi:hypothetical protein
MPRFRNAPSRRRQPAPTAKWLVLGLTEARLVALGQRTTHLLPVKPSHHRKRFLSGQRLAVKAYVGGPTECHVTVTDAQRVQLGHVDYAAVRELGYPYLDAFRVAWVDEHETAWRAGETVARSTCSSGSIAGTRTRRCGWSGSHWTACCRCGSSPSAARRATPRTPPGH